MAASSGCFLPLIIGTTASYSLLVCSSKMVNHSCETFGASQGIIAYQSASMYSIPDTIPASGPFPL